MVELGHLSTLGTSDQAVSDEAFEDLIQVAWLDLDRSTCPLADGLREAIPMLVRFGESEQNEQLDRS